MRLQKYLAVNGVSSRRKCEEFIKKGKVKVNGVTVTEMGRIIDSEKDVIIYNNEIVTIKNDYVYILLNKPEGYISSVKDNFNRGTVLDLVSVKERVYPVGRLDYDSQGLLLLTNDGELTQHLTHPKHHIKKIYEAKLKGKPSREELDSFKNGLVIDNYKTEKSQIKIIEEYRNNSLVEIVIWEGRNRQIRKMCEKINHPVIKLKRIGVGSLGLGDLPLGKWRYLTKEEIDVLKEM